MSVQSCRLDSRPSLRVQRAAAPRLRGQRAQALTEPTSISTVLRTKPTRDVADFEQVAQLRAAAYYEVRAAEKQIQCKSGDRPVDMRTVQVYLGRSPPPACATDTQRSAFPVLVQPVASGVLATFCGRILHRSGLQAHPSGLRDDSTTACSQAVRRTGLHGPVCGHIHRAVSARRSALPAAAHAAADRRRGSHVLVLGGQV